MNLKRLFPNLTHTLPVINGNFLSQKEGVEHVDESPIGVCVDSKRSSRIGFQRRNKFPRTAQIPVIEQVLVYDRIRT